MSELQAGDMPLLEALSANSAEWWLSNNQWVSYDWYSCVNPDGSATWILPQVADRLVNDGYAQVLNAGRMDQLLIITPAGRDALAAQ